VAFEQIRLDVADHVATVTLNRPDRLNAFTPLMGDELLQAFDLTDADDEVRAVVVTGAGRGFCAGADIGDGPGTFDLGETAPRDPGGVVSLRIYRSSKPVIAAINGAAVGIGATMTLPMDARLVSDGAKIGFVFTRLGLVPEGCSTWFLPRLVGISQATDWVLSGRIFGATEASEKGLARSVHQPDELLAAAHALAREWTEHTAPVSVALARHMLWNMMGEPHPIVAHDAESLALWSRGRSADGQEGVAAFLEKRDAMFTDRVSNPDATLFAQWTTEPISERHEIAIDYQSPAKTQQQDTSDGTSRSSH
jgi:enoyl-CoA hydratase/carnithine racemase